MPFAQLIIGPPGSGKSTYCSGMHQFLSAIGRKSSIVNLDPANERTNYPCAIDIRSLITLDEIMQDEELGPNGGVLWALEELESQWEWLEGGLKGLGALHLTDSYCLTLPSLYISTLLLSLRSMLQLDLPHLNVLTKIDNLSSYGPLPFDLEFYTEAQDLSDILPHLLDENPVMRHPKFEGLNTTVIELVEDFGLVGFETLVVEDKKSMMTLLQAIDRAGGYAFGGAEGANDTIWQVSVREGMKGLNARDVQERWIDRKEEFDEMERKELEEEAARASGAVGAVDGGEGGEEEDEEMEAMRREMPDSGVKIVRKQ
ncbi:MAG: hypothetical protein L6R37_000791 [Teloschistes peruensis]|nr:MAG: hypothetical protein L6R37_000791 [Teloschistes peruensis]